MVFKDLKKDFYGFLNREIFEDHFLDGLQKVEVSIHYDRVYNLEANPCEIYFLFYMLYENKIIKKEYPIALSVRRTSEDVALCEKLYKEFYTKFEQNNFFHIEPLDFHLDTKIDLPVPLLKGGASALPKEGYLYFIKADIVNLVKIGITKNLRTRMSALISHSPVPLSIFGHVKMEGFGEMEKKLHEHFKKDRSHGEWFNLNLEELSGILKEKFEIELSHNDDWKNDKWN